MESPLRPGRVDLHCHVLTAVDDGPKTREASLAVCRAAVADGTSVVGATAHQGGRYPNRASTIRAAVARLQEWIAEEQIPLEVQPVGEWMIDPDWFDRFPDTLDEFVPIGTSAKYALVEFPFTCPHHATVIASSLQAFQLVPVLAHVDRYGELLLNPDRVAALIDGGFVISMNADSIDGRSGDDVQHYCRHLLEMGYVHLITSDGHNTERRPPRLSAAASVIGEWLGDGASDLLFRQNPLAILEGTSPTRLSPMPSTKRRSWWSRFFRSSRQK